MVEKSATVTRSAEVLVASNRGPFSFSLEPDGSLSVRRGGGGVVSGLSSIGSESGSVWVCAALSDADRKAADGAPGGRLDLAGYSGLGGPDGKAAEGTAQRVRMLNIPPDVFAGAYNGIANSVLWFVHHMLYDTPTEPVFEADLHHQWAAYQAYNAAFADALAEEAAPNATVLVQDYHLALAPSLLRERRPDLLIGHFSHTPWAPPDYYRLLPDDIAAAVLTGMLGADRAAFLTGRWAESFASCCAAVLDARVTGGEAGEDLAVTYRGHTTRIGVHGLGADADFLLERSHRPDVEERLAALRQQVGDRKIVMRVDRTELSKNIVRGLLAYRDLLRGWPEWLGRVVHVAFAYPSRYDLAVYRQYTEAVQRVADEITEEFGTEEWQPLILHVQDDFARSLAAYRMADVALVNPVRDGMNLVAKEVPVVSDKGCALVLSREAGAAAELGDDAILVNPFDVQATAEALHQALSMPAEERAERSRRLAAAATALPPRQWFRDQLTALRGLSQPRAD